MGLSSHQAATTNDTFAIIQNIVAEITGIEPEETLLTTHLDIYDLADIPGIIKKINAKFGIVLHPRAVLEECETIQDLVELVEDEAEYDSDFGRMD